MKQQIKDLAKRPDPPAAVLGAILTLCGVWNVSERLGITADELGMVLGALITIAAAIRHRVEVRK